MFLQSTKVRLFNTHIRWLNYSSRRSNTSPDFEDTDIHSNKIKIWARHAGTIPAYREQKQADRLEFKASLEYIVTTK